MIEKQYKTNLKEAYKYEREANQRLLDMHIDNLIVDGFYKDVEKINITLDKKQKGARR